MSSSWCWMLCCSLLCSTVIPIRSDQSIDHSMERTNSSMKRMNRKKWKEWIKWKEQHQWTADVPLLQLQFTSEHTHSGLRFDSPLCSVLLSVAVSFHFVQKGYGRRSPRTAGSWFRWRTSTPTSYLHQHYLQLSTTSTKNKNKPIQLL
jgi:hypothetical protein